MLTDATKQMISTLPVQWYEYFTERASILEYCAHVPREEAENAAWMETAAAMLKAKGK